MEAYDVIVVGAGPAGISTALHLERLAPHLARRTLILEKATHPRPKPCGGGLTMDGVVILRQLGLNVLEISYAKASAACLVFEGYQFSLQTQDGTDRLGFYVFRREELDTWLVQKARERGLTVLENTPVQRVVPDADGVEVVTLPGRYRAKVVVGADGAHSIVRRAIPHPRPLRHPHTLLIWAPPKGESSHHPEYAYFDFSCISRGVPGYIWDFPIVVDGEPTRCWGIYDSGVIPRDEKGLLREIFAAELARHGYRLEDYPLRGAVIFPFHPKGPFSAPRILLVGDAAGVDIFYGEGISFSLGYGRIAAQSIADAFARGDFSFADFYHRVLHSELGKALSWRTHLARWFYSFRFPLFYRLVWRWGRSWMEKVTLKWMMNWALREKSV